MSHDVGPLDNSENDTREAVRERMDAIVAAEPVADSPSASDTTHLGDRASDVDPAPADYPRTAHTDESQHALVQPQIHELGANLLFADPTDGLSPYYALLSIIDEVDRLRGTGEPLLEDVCGSDWITPDGYRLSWKSGIAARREPYDRYYEYQLLLVADDAHVDDQTRSISYQFRVARPNLENPDGDPIGGIPDDLPEGVRVQVNSSNVGLEEALDLLQAAMDRLGVRPSYFSPRKLHEWSSIYNLAYYVRLRRPVAEARISGHDGLIDDIAQFGSAANGRGMYKWDHEDIEGHYQAVTLDPETWGLLRSSVTHGWRLKSYHMATPERQAGSVTSHPKLEIQLSGQYSSTTPDWADRETLVAEAQDLLLNALAWAGIGLDPADPAFVPDAYFDPADGSPEPLRSDAVEICDNPIDALADVERDLATIQLLDADLSDAQERVVKTLADCGNTNYRRLAEAADTSVSTVYRALDKIDRVVEHVDGEIRLVDSVVRDQLSSLFDSIERSAELFARRVEDVLDYGLVEDEDSPFGRWLRAHGGAIRDLSPAEAPVVGGYGRAEDWIEVDLTLGQYTVEEVKRLLREGGIAARETSLETLEHLRKTVVRYRDREGQERTQIVAARHGGVIKAGGGRVI